MAKRKICKKCGYISSTYDTRCVKCGSVSFSDDLNLDSALFKGKYEYYSLEDGTFSNTPLTKEETPVDNPIPTEEKPVEDVVPVETPTEETKEEKFKVCPRCGTINGEHLRFCSNTSCNAMLTRVEAKTKAEIEKDKEAPVKEEPKEKNLFEDYVLKIKGDYKSLEFDDRGIMPINRRLLPENDLSIRYVSRQHAELRFDKTNFKFYIKDLKSTTGTGIIYYDHGNERTRELPPLVEEEIKPSDSFILGYKHDENYWVRITLVKLTK